VKRFGIEASYRLSEGSIATTSTQSPVVRLLYVVVSLLLQNVWQYLHREYVATPRRGASPLGVVVQGIHQHDVTGSVNGPRGASGRPHKPTIGRPVHSVITNQDRLRREWRRLSVNSFLILLSRSSAHLLRYRTPVSETTSCEYYLRY